MAGHIIDGNRSDLMDIRSCKRRPERCLPHEQHGEYNSAFFSPFFPWGEDRQNEARRHLFCDAGNYPHHDELMM